MEINSIAPVTQNQFIYPELQFTCNGTITKWIFGAGEQVPPTATEQPELQIWRQTGPDTYTRQGFSLVTANETASPNVHEYYPETPLQFQQGDVLGIFYPSTENANPLLYGQEGNGPLNLASIGLRSSRITASQLIHLNNMFPMVSPVIGMIM